MTFPPFFFLPILIIHSNSFCCTQVESGKCAFNGLAVRSTRPNISSNLACRPFSKYIKCIDRRILKLKHSEMLSQEHSVSEKVRVWVRATAQRATILHWATAGENCDLQVVPNLARLFKRVGNPRKLGSVKDGEKKLRARKCLTRASSFWYGGCGVRRRIFLSWRGDTRDGSDCGSQRARRRKWNVFYKLCFRLSRLSRAISS